MERQTVDLGLHTLPSQATDHGLDRALRAAHAGDGRDRFQRDREVRRAAGRHHPGVETLELELGAGRQHLHLFLESRRVVGRQFLRWRIRFVA